jgi:hypothetical protein
VAYVSGTHPASTPFRTTLATPLTTAGFTRVTQDYTVATGQILDVWKSPGASNASGQDWYLLLMDDTVTTAGQRMPRFSVCELWDDATKTATRYIPNTNNVVPAGDYSVGATAVTPTTANVYYQQNTSLGGWVDTSGTPYKASITIDRCIVSINPTNSSFISCYAGQTQRIHNTTVEPYPPLIVLEMTGNTTFSNASTTRGGITREVGQTAAATSNFRVFLFNSAGTDSVWAPFADSVTGATTWSPLWVWSNRANQKIGILIGPRTTNVNGTPTDIGTETLVDGSTLTYTNAQLFNNQPQRFFPQV